MVGARGRRRAGRSARGRCRTHPQWPDGVTHIVTLAAVSTLDRDLLTHLVRQLVAALRRAGTGVISICGGRPDVDDALLTEDGAQAPQPACSPPTRSAMICSW